jgi:hypothetical protein
LRLMWLSKKKKKSKMPKSKCKSEKKGNVKKPKETKHEQCPFAMRPSPQDLCNECVSKKD